MWKRVEYFSLFRHMGGTFGYIMMQVYHGRFLLDQAVQLILSPDDPVRSAGLRMNISDDVVTAGTPQIDEIAFTCDMLLGSISPPNYYP